MPKHKTMPLNPALLAALLADELDQRSVEPLTDEKRAKNKLAALAFVEDSPNIVGDALGEETTRAQKTKSYVDIDMVMRALIPMLLKTLPPSDYQETYNTY